MKEFNVWGWLAFAAVLIGGICWGLAGLFNVFIITSIFGNLLGRLIYIAVGAGAGYLCYLIYLEKFKKTPM